MKPDQEKRLNRLIAGVVDETATQDQFEQLEAILDSDVAAQSHYLRYIGLHQDLGEIVGCGGGAPFPEKAHSARNWLLTAVCLVAVLLTAFFAYRVSKPVAQIVDYDGPVSWVKQGGEVTHELVPGQAIRKGWIETKGAESWAKIQFPDDTVIQVSGIGKLHIESVKGQKKLHLDSGNISVDASPQPAGRPLLLSTSAAEAEVVGTQFNVVANDYSTSLEVNEGLVKVKRLADGLVEEVEPDYEVVAALESGGEFVARPRQQFTDRWESDMPRDTRFGHPTEGQSVRARTHLWRGDKKLNETLKRPVLLHSVVLDPSAKRMPPLRIDSGRRLFVSGRVTKPVLVNIGFATHRLKGGFAGKYISWRQVERAGEFVFQIPLPEMKRNRDGFPESPVGYEMSYLWVQTLKENAGLEVSRVEFK